MSEHEAVATATKGKRKRRVVRKRVDPWERRRTVDALLRLWDHRAVKIAVQFLAVVIAVAAIVLIAKLQTDAEARLARGEGAVPLQGATLIELRDGTHTVILQTDGRIDGLENLPLADQQTIRGVLAAQRIDAPAVLRPLLERRAAVLAATDPSAMSVIISPAWTVIGSDQPTFRWSTVPGAAQYRVRVYDEASSEVTASPVVRVTNWRPPRPLARDKTYLWRVTALGPAPANAESLTTPEARFLLVGVAEARRVDQLRLLYQARRLTLGVLYAGAGFRQEAEAELQALLNANPSAQAAQKLLRSVQDWQ
jgi:hypothetical protein